MSKFILQIIYSCSVQKSALKNTKHSRNETMLKIGRLAKAIAHADYSLCKMVNLGPKLKMPKSCKKAFYKNMRVVLCKEPDAKTPNI